MTAVAAVERSSESKKKSEMKELAMRELRFEPPGPGSWTLDAEHCERPHSRWVADLMPPIYTEAFRRGMARYGSLLETIEMQMVHGFAYVAMRPVGAPPDAKGTPPRPLFWLLTRLHPALRKRIRRCAEVFEKKIWRDDTTEFFERVMPSYVERFERIQAMRLEDLTDEALIAHLRELIAMLDEQMHDHFMRGTAAMLPVGDFVVHATGWTGCSREEAIALLNGYSPYSVEALRELDDVVEALRADPSARALLDAAGEAGATLERLAKHDSPVGPAAERFLARVGQRIVTGHDVAEMRGIELPEMLLGSIRARLSVPPRDAERARTDAATADLRQRVPEADRARFDELLEEARFVHPMRDAHSVVDFWAFGLIRRGLLEAGARLHARGRLHVADHVVDLTQPEIESLLMGGEGPTADQVVEHVRHRTTRTMNDAPRTLGGAPGSPPPPEWLPGAAARTAAAMNVYLELMFLDDSRAYTKTEVVTGTAASSGRYVGTARLVLSPGDFAKVRRGDVLIARITTPAYNVLLPMIGAVVTDRGGLLSHPAIVSREYGIPGVVGTRDATTRIADGARVEVDGSAGTVRVLP